MRRHRPLVMALASMAVIFCAGSIGVAWRESVLSSRVAEQRDVAIREARRAEEVTEFLRSMFASVGPSHGAAFRGMSPVDVADRYDGSDVRLHEVLSQAEATLRVRPMEDTLSEAMIRQWIGGAWNDLGKSSWSEKQLTLAYERFIQEDPVGLSAYRVADQLGSVKSALGKFDEADELLSVAIRGKRELLGDDDDEVRLSEKNLAVLRYFQGRPEEAEVLLDKLVAAYSEAGDSDLRMAELWSIGSVMKRERGDLVGALELCRAAYEVQRIGLGFGHPDTLSTANNLALILQSHRQLAEAEPLMREVVAEQRRGFGNDHRNTVKSVVNLAGLLHARGRLDEAEKLYDEASATQRRNHREHEPLSQKLRAHQAMLALSQLDRPEEAAGVERDLDRQRETLGEGHRETLQTMTNLGMMYLKVGRTDDSERLLSEVLALRTESETRLDQKSIHLLYYLGAVRLAQGRPPEAEAFFAEALAWLGWLGDSNGQRMRIELGLGRALTESNCLDEADRKYREIVSEMQERAAVAPGAKAMLGRLLARHSDVLHRQGRLAEAYDLGLEGYGILESIGGQPGWLEDAGRNLRQIYRAADQVEVADWLAN